MAEHRPSQAYSEIGEAHFAVLAKLMRSRGASARAARLVLVSGMRIGEASQATGLTQPAVSQAVKRYRQAHQLIQASYGPVLKLEKVVS